MTSWIDEERYQDEEPKSRLKNGFGIHLNLLQLRVITKTTLIWQWTNKGHNSKSSAYEMIPIHNWSSFWRIREGSIEIEALRTDSIESGQEQVSIESNK
jgi:hypothetical protein